METNVKKSKKPITLGIISLITWIIPIIGAIVSICGIVSSSRRLKEYKCKAYQIGFGLNIVGLILTILNFGIGFYLRMKMMA